MQLQWVSVALTLTGVFIWFSGGNQGLGYGIFMAGGVMWFILERAEKKRQEEAKQAPINPIAHESSVSQKPQRPRQSDAE
jgi:hypothetical protein